MPPELPDYRSIPFEQMPQAITQVFSFVDQHRATELIGHRAVLDLQAALRHPQPAHLIRAEETLVQFSLQTLAGTTDLFTDDQRPDFENLEVLSKFSLMIGLQIARVIDKVKRDTVGRDSPTDVSNYLIGRVLNHLGWALPVVDHEIIDGLDRLQANFTNAGAANETIDWHTPKIEMFTGALFVHKTNVELIDGLAARQQERPQGDVAELRTANDSLFQASGVLQKYGVKPCVAPSLLDKGIVRDWLIMDKQSIGTPDRTVATKFVKQHGLAVFIGSNKRISSSHTETIDIMNRHDGYVRLTGLHAPGLQPDATRDRFWLGYDGELYSYWGDRIVDFLDHPEQLVAYEILRSQIIALYYDLTVPVYVTEVVDQELRQAPTEPGRSRGVLNKMRRLVLARERVLRELQDEIIEGLDRGDDTLATIPPRERSRGQVAEHPVVHFIRPLPKGFHPSIKQRELCREVMNGKELGDNETFVRDHKRGSKRVETAGHRAVFRAGKVADSMAAQNGEDS